MLPRFVVFMVVIFWVGSITWLFYRDVLPLLNANDPPPIHIGLEDEIAKRMVMWQVLRDDKEIGTATTEIARGEDQLFKLRIDFRFQDFQILMLKLRKLSGTYLCTSNGRLKAMSSEVIIGLGGLEHSIRFEGKINGTQFVPKLLWNGIEQKGIVEPVELTNGPAIIDTLHPHNRITGLWEGRSWKVPSFNPINAVLAKHTSGLLGESHAMPTLLATVVSDTITWQDEEVDCWRIDYFEPGRTTMGKTWVRKRDGLVVQQLAEDGTMRLMLIRQTIR